MRSEKGHFLLGLAVLLALGAPLQAQSGQGATAHSGAAGSIAVTPPRLDTAIVVDGELSELPWSHAALLTGFSQYRPVDGRPAEDSTQVLVWYSPEAMFFGVRAFEAHGAVHATLADRDRIQADDYVQILLDTFHEGRRAMVVSVNPLGVQSDGILSEGSQTRGGGLGTTPSFRDTVDLTPNFVFQSKGRVTDFGYQVEIRLPFKSLRFQSNAAQVWGINIDRRVQHSGYEDTWAPVRQASPSFLAQSGRLEGLRGLERGLVLDLTPEVTSRVDGLPFSAGTGGTGGWYYDARRPEVGGNVRWGITSNLNLNGTANPDFSQVEADVQQISYDPRSAVFFPETRPFFVEGSEQFESPNNLIYTRRIVSPRGAVKLSGKVSDWNVGFLSAADDRALSATGRTPWYTLLRARTDLGGQSTWGVVSTNRYEGSDYNRVLASDARLFFARLYNVRLQLGQSVTRTAGVTTKGPLWDFVFQRSGRRFGMQYTFNGLHPDFEAQSGFIRRRDIVNAGLQHRFTFFGQPGAKIENWTTDVRLTGNWYYRDFRDGQAPADPKFHFTNSATLRGGWVVGLTLLLESFEYDPRLFTNYYLERTLASGVKDTVPYPTLGRIPNIGSAIDIATPRFARFSANANFILSQDEDFLEWSPAFDVFMTIQADWRPSERLRVTGRYVRQQYLRRGDWTTVQNRQIPRLKIEYQLSRPIFVRLVAQYDTRFHDTLRDDTRTGFPVLLYNPSSNSYTRASREEINAVRVDWLFSYRPTPGTVFFLGYGASLTEPEAFRFRGMERVSDGFFAKFSYLFRVGAN
ncbi:MAG: carbohydrate binding family 9 domain-containing protein [Gemmatimonadetes bacterium]|nr:carbohydrate binding family 9 domain-containing protein [Gemmatimonadota bacterium]